MAAGSKRSKCCDISISDLADVFRPFVKDNELPDINYSETMTSPLNPEAIMKAKQLLCAIRQKVPSLLLAGSKMEGAMKELGVTDFVRKSKMLKCMLYRIKQTRPGVPWVQNLFQTGQSSIEDYAQSSEETQQKRDVDAQPSEEAQQKAEEQTYFYGWDGGLKKAWRQAVDQGIEKENIQWRLM